MKHYDFIICGGGMSGLSLAYYLNQSSLREKSVLIIEPEEKNKNDRTWAFWEAEESAFEHILFKKWNQVRFANIKGEKRILDIGNFKYKLLRGIDFYEFVTNEIKSNPKIEWLKERVVSLNDRGWGVEVKTTSKTLTANFAFDSTYKLDLSLSRNHNQLQHFKGLVVETKEKKFDPTIPDMMNFSIEQKKSECRFMYVLPFSETKALIEFTLFSDKLLKENEYDNEIENFIRKDLQIVDYQVHESEFGVIPMSDVSVNEFPSRHIIRIGTAGGQTNPATGYTFQNTQKRLIKMVESLEKTGYPLIVDSWFNKRFQFYASVLLNVLEKGRHPLADVFDKMYLKNPPERIFRFLDGETNFIEELKIMWSTPKPKFISAVFDVLKKKLR